MRKLGALFVGVLAVALFALPASGALSADSTKVYIVQMLPNPVVTYAGGIPGLPATKPGKGKKIDRNSSDVKKYADYLNGKHVETLNKVGGGEKLYDYVYSLNGFAAKLTEAQAARVAGQKDVLAVSPDELQTITTSSTPHFLGLDANGGLWDQLGGVSKGGLSRGAGEDEVIGVIDSGIWPESQSFSDRKLDGSSGNNYPHQVTGFSGACVAGEQWTASDCNSKLISARYFNAAQGGNDGINKDFPWEFTSARDYNGHGTHTSSTAGGNFGVEPTGDAAAAGFTAISGMAPRARIATYKALWSSQDGSTASGANSDIVEAIDEAVADGVDVINYSVGPSTPPPNFLSPEQVSFLNAAAAGIFVSAAAGNEGAQGPGSVKNPGPWITTVAAGTHNRASLGSVTLGNGTTINGASSGNEVGPAPFVDSSAVGVTGADATKLAQCYSADANAGTAVLDPAKVNGTIVLCNRGGNARTDKSLAVKNAGGIGMVLVNTSPNSLNADIHFVPTVHVDDTNASALHAYAGTAGATAKINQSQTVFNAPAPQLAAFSSLGPQVAGAGDLLKPDVMAPGVDVLAAVSPAADHGRLFDLLSGTSMATPHVAGVAALLKQLHPNWSPMAVKSALMTSAYDMVDGAGNTVNSSSPSVIFAEGAGHIRPNSAADPGLVFDSNVGDWIAFLCGTKNISGPPLCSPPPTGFGSIDPSDLNMASIAVGDLAGEQTVTRAVTNVGSNSATYTASVQAPAGVTVNVSPTSFTIAAGQTKTFTVTLTRTTAALVTYVGGHLTWSDGTHNVRIPLVVRPVALAAPAEVAFTTAAGPVSWDVKTGYSGAPLNASVRGLVAAHTQSWNVTQDPDQNWVNCGDTQGAAELTVNVPAGTTIVRIGIYEDAITPTGTDLDLFVCRNGGLAAFSADGDSNEEVTLSFAAPLAVARTYVAYVHGFSTNGPSASGTLFDWSVPATSAGNTTLTVTPPGNATVGGTKTVTATFTGLAAATRYMGAVDYNDGSTALGRTLVRINTP